MRLPASCHRLQIGSAVLGVLILLSLGGWSLATWASDRPPADVGRLTPVATKAPVRTSACAAPPAAASVPPATAAPGAPTVAAAASARPAVPAASGVPAGSGAAGGGAAAGGCAGPAKLSDLQATVDRAPSTLSIPTIGAGAPIVAVGTDPATGELAVPHNATTVVWWQDGARPGDPTGTTVLAAHVDWNGAEGVFFHLDRLAVGATVTVADDSGVQHRYRVVARRHVAKPALAGQDLFRTTGPPRLALVTCGGAFDTAKHSYEDNVVVLAVPA